MPSANNCDRIFFAIQQVAIADDNSTSFLPVKGAQSVSVSADSPLQEVLQLGKYAVYAQLEDLPDVNVSVDKVLDGTPLIYHLATVGATAPTLVGRSQASCILALSIFNSTQDSASGTPVCTAQLSGFYVNSLNYTFNTDDAFKESVSFIGNDIISSDGAGILNATDSGRAASAALTGFFTDPSDPNVVINRSQHLIYEYSTGAGLDLNGRIADADTTILPTDIDGISDSGTNELTSGVYNSLVQSIDVSADLAREEIKVLGQLQRACRYIGTNIEVTTQIDVLPKNCPFISATANGILNTGTSSCDGVFANQKNHTIRIATCDGTRIYTGIKNKRQSWNYSGGDTSGGNVTISYTYRTLNDLTVLHINDPNSNGSTWWTNRNTYLLDT